VDAPAAIAAAGALRARTPDPMHATLPQLLERPFPAISRLGVDSLQANLGYRCNQRCAHCHVAAGPERTEVMGPEVIADVIRFLWARRVRRLDLTGGAPELNPGFRALVARARSLGVEVVDRCNLTILEEPGQEDLAAFLADHAVRVVASLPCYAEGNVDAQRGKGTYARSIRALRRLNALGYGTSGALGLDLVYNPTGPSLPPPQADLEARYRVELATRHGVTFDRLLTLANVPIARFGSALVSTGRLASYLDLLQGAHQEANLPGVMCRRTLSVDWEGFVYDCDFNQMLGLSLAARGAPRPRLRDLLQADLAGTPIRVGAHCYACTAGQGSSCDGALSATPPAP
jgi:radical SAM/Cys-rich protein